MGYMVLVSRSHYNCIIRKFLFWPGLLHLYACYWSCKHNSLLGSIAFSRCPILTIFKVPNIGYRVFDSPWDNVPFITVLWEISYVHKASYACYLSCKPFRSQMVFPRVSSSLNMKPKIWDTMCKRALIIIFQLQNLLFSAA